MATEITMPQLSDTMDKGTILRWFKKEGDKISRGDALAEVATDKADLEIESFHEGTLLKINAPEGETVQVGAIIAVIGAAGETASTSSAQTPKVSPQSTTVSEPIQLTKQTEVPQKTDYVSGPVSFNNIPAPESINDRVKISPLAKNIAKNHGLDYSRVSGTGEGGRIVKRDVEQHIQTPRSENHNVVQEVKSSHGQSDKIAPVSNTAQIAKSITPTISGQARVEPLSRMRETIANRMVESVNTAPHFFATAKIDVSSLLHMREVLKTQSQYEGITVTHLVTKACGLALRKFPRINSRFENNNIVEPQDINIGIITALPDGLLIPVLKAVDQIHLADVVQESKALIQRARSGKPKGDDLSGGTFSISNIGKSNVEHFTAIINPGQGAILAVSGMQEEALVKNGNIVIGQTMRVTISVDHRIIDGVLAGEFLTYLKQLLEEPVLLLA